ncbi:homocitrate synthase family protein [Methanobrevibacter filiformis]|uniref:2-isopropylmalate synthase n=1 Tax=Methanobrevibacter filiformis TaxID=55758 RepID=A0A162FBH7_9EURY|nr:homocitrate synthase family protein [Methanobrevibacter filiformis]KZX10635.1 2-isopropylmalate synthase [Methanobrevibacter filiformis]
MQHFISPYNKKAKIKFPKEITIYDTTLRDGEQTPGVCLGKNEKLEIAIELDKLKIHQIEAGFPIVSKREQESVKAITSQGLNAQILSLARTKKEDIDAALDCDVDGIITFMGASDIHLKHKMKVSRDEALAISMNAVEYAKEHDLFVAFSAEDATRTDLDFLKTIYKQAESYGVDRVHIADTVGAISPQGMDYLVRELRKDITTGIAMHCHNDFGMALSNSIAGLIAGGNAVSTTVNGIGERAGNTSLEELVMALTIVYGVDLGFNLENIQNLSKVVEKHVKIPISDNKSIVGKNIFRHESGIHVDAVIEEPLTYEPFLPELIGQKRHLVLGKHSGASAVKAKLKQYDFTLNDLELKEIVKEVKTVRENGKYITDEVFLDIVDKILNYTNYN